MFIFVDTMQNANIILNTNNDIAPKELFFISALLSDMCEHIETANIIKIQNL